MCWICDSPHPVDGNQKSGKLTSWAKGSWFIPLFTRGFTTIPTGGWFSRRISNSWTVNGHVWSDPSRVRPTSASGSWMFQWSTQASERGAINHRPGKFPPTVFGPVFLEGMYKRDPEISGKILVKSYFIWPEMWGGGECGRSAKLLPIDSKMSDCTFQSFEFFSPLKSCWAEKSPDRLVPTTRGELLNFGVCLQDSVHIVH